jgi:hypothetical protein
MPTVEDKLGPFFTPLKKSALVDVFDLDIQRAIGALGSVQSQAFSSLADIAVVATATSASADGFRLRDCSLSKGEKKVQYVINRSASQVRVYAPTGGTLNGVLNGSVTLTSATHGQFVCINQSTNEYVKL